MAEAAPVEERVRIGEAPRRLEAAVAHPAGATAGAVVCHPHPCFGGDMDTAVVVAVAGALAARGLATLRFNFGGVGASEGTRSEGAEAVGDVHVAAAALAGRLPPDAPLVLVGYSFGAWAALRATGDGCRARRVIAIAPPLAFSDWSFLDGVETPITLVVGDRDRFCPVDRADALAAPHRGRRTVRLAGADHFLHGREDDVAAVVIAAALPSPGGG